MFPLYRGDLKSFSKLGEMSLATCPSGISVPPFVVWAFFSDSAVSASFFIATYEVSLTDFSELALTSVC